MANKKKPRKHDSHYCRICGEYKANEKFSGKGHAAHICKKCAALPVTERNEMETANKIAGMAFRHLSESEINWLRGKMYDSRPEIREAARMAHGIKFPRYERNMIKKGLTAFSLELFIHGDVWDEWGDEVSVHTLVTMDNTGVIRRISYDAPEDERETEISIDRQDACRFLKSVIHELDALFWDEDLSDGEPGEYDPYLDILPEYLSDSDVEESDMDGNDDIEDELSDIIPGAGQEKAGGERQPLWSLRLELNNGQEKLITFYNQLHDEPLGLFWSIMEWFEPVCPDEADDVFDDTELPF